MPSTSNKGYTVPTTGTEVDTWGDDLNANFQGKVDLNLGGLLTKSLTNVTPVNLSSTESENLIVRLTGTISADIVVNTVALGMTMVENATSGAFTVSFGLSGVGSPVVIPQGTKAVIITDGTNGARTVADNQTEFASGTRMLFHQTAAPTNWTKDTSRNDFALRLVNGAVGSGGAVGFTTAFASTRTPTGSLNTTTVSGTVSRDGWGDNGVGYGSNTQGRIAVASGQTENTEFLNSLHAANNDRAISTDAHGHTFTGDAMNFAVNYVDVIIAQKN